MTITSPTAPSGIADWLTSLAVLNPYAHQDAVTELLRETGRNLGPNPVVVDVGPVLDVTRELCPDCSTPGTVTVGYFPSEGDHRDVTGICPGRAQEVMRDAVDFHGATYLDVEVRVADPWTGVTR